jgi:hypothetical protein
MLGATTAVHTPPGYLLFVRERTLMAQPCLGRVTTDTLRLALARRAVAMRPIRRLTNLSSMYPATEPWYIAKPAAQQTQCR